ncbi:hypothetical protein AB0D30_29365 [Streptomyces sp. NPDC048409]|uniref:hypothetical protein n=1 Tax=unclassified Streptomyces TaxID=2593676 RepID=UPI00343BB756
MSDQQDGGPVPRDLPDQQARPDDRDPWDAPEGSEPDTRDDDGLPGTDEAGTGLRDAPRPGVVRPEEPLPEEPSA